MAKALRRKLARLRRGKLTMKAVATDATGARATDTLALALAR